MTAGRPCTFWRPTAPRAVVLVETSRTAEGGTTGFGGNPELVLLCSCRHPPRYTQAPPLMRKCPKAVAFVPLDSRLRRE